MTPFIVSGQTLLPVGQYVQNPTPNVLGFVGEITSLPYTVPVGCQLRLFKWGVEAYGLSVAVIGMNCWVGASFTSDKCLPSVNTGGQATNEFESARGWVLPAGTVFNVALYNAGPNQAYESWWVEGAVELASCDP